MLRFSEKLGHLPRPSVSRHFWWLAFIDQPVARWDLKEETEEFWRESARDEIQKRIEQSQNINMSKAKNTVLLIGDGMGITTMTAGRILIDGENHMTQEDYQNDVFKGP